DATMQGMVPNHTRLYQSAGRILVGDTMGEGSGHFSGLIGRQRAGVEFRRPQHKHVRRISISRSMDYMVVMAVPASSSMTSAARGHQSSMPTSSRSRL